MATTNGQGSKKKRSDLNLYLIASFFALLRMVIPSAKCHANQCKTFRRATSGCRILVSLVHEMVKRDARKGLATLCIGGGQGVALTIERD